MNYKKVRRIDLGNDFGAVALKVNGIRLEIADKGKSINVSSGTPIALTVAVSLNTPQTATAIAAAKEALEIGDRMKDGTVVIAVDLKKNIALFAPEGIFGGSSTFASQDIVVSQANYQNLHGKKDWRRITDKEARALAKIWDKVAPPALLDSTAPWFWGESGGSTLASVFRGGESALKADYTPSRHPVPVVRSAPAHR